MVSEKLGHSSVAFTMDVYSHVVPGLQKMAARRIEMAIGDEAMRILGAEVDVERMSVKCWQNGLTTRQKRAELRLSRTGIEPVTC